MSKLFPCWQIRCATYVLAHFRHTTLIGVEVHHTSYHCEFAVERIEPETWYRRIAKKR